MDNNAKIVDFFLGANSSKGFYSLFKQLEIPVKSWRSFVIKGGPGTGKSNMMKKIVDNFEDKRGLIEKIHCSSDIDSLDGVILHNCNCSIVDATSPHVIEPDLPGVYETTVNFCQAFDEELLNSRFEQIISAKNAGSIYHEKCCKLLNCAQILLNDNYEIALACTDTKKIENFAKRIKALEFSLKGNGAKEHVRYLSAVTNKGITAYLETPTKLCKNIYVIKDDFSCTSSLFLSLLREYALASELEIFTCFCSMKPTSKIEHIFIPELNLGFMTWNKFLDLSQINPYKVVNYARFTDKEKLGAYKQRISFNKKLATQLINSAVQTLKNAKICHDQLEKFYNDAVDFSLIDAQTSEVIRKMLKRYK
ncbi:MAG: hypothetical protein RR497_00355 [Oscillospiraceae bacterium]